MLDERTGGSACSPVWDESSAAPLALRDVGVSPDTQPCRTGLTFGFRPLRGLLLSAPNASAFLSGMLGFPLIPSPTGLGSRLASGPYGPVSFGPERIGLPLSLSAAPTDPLLQPRRTRHPPAHTHAATPSASSTGDIADHLPRCKPLKTASSPTAPPPRARKNIGDRGLVPASRPAVASAPVQALNPRTCRSLRVARKLDVPGKECQQICGCPLFSLC